MGGFIKLFHFFLTRCAFIFVLSPEFSKAGIFLAQVEGGKPKIYSSVHDPSPIFSITNLNGLLKQFHSVSTMTSTVAASTNMFILVSSFEKGTSQVYIYQIRWATAWGDLFVTYFLKFYMLLHSYCKHPGVGS